MDASETGKAKEPKPLKLDAREARLAQALRANLRRRKASEAPPEPPPEPPRPQGAPDEGD